MPVQRSIAILLLTTAGLTDLMAEDHDSRFSDEPGPLLLEGFPDRPAPLLELGDKFLSPGKIQKGSTLPTGAVWQPSFWVFGNYRTAVQTFDNGPNRVSEWANDLNLYGNLRLSATERFVIGINPLRNRRGEFTGYTFEPDAMRGWDEDFKHNFQPSTLYFEGELGELFPRWDNADRRSLDYGISVGRQPLKLQDGILVDDDRLDVVTVTRNTLLPGIGSNLKLSGLFAWNEIQRADNLDDGSARLFGLDGALDLRLSTLEADLLYVSGDDQSDGLYAGLGAIQRIGKFSTAFRVNQSIALENESAAVRNGTLFFAEISIEPPRTHNNLYFNGYLGLGDYSSAVRGPLAGGPIGRAGILFAAVGLGRYDSPLSNRATESTGGAFGYQMFFGPFHRRQLILEAGGLTPLHDDGVSAAAIGSRYQQALGQRTVFALDVFGAAQEASNDAFGARLEFLVKF